MRVLGIVLIVAGIAAFVLPYIPFTEREKVVDIGPIEAVAEREERIPVSPIIGVVLVAAGAAVIVAGGRRQSS
ncbi:MAG: hypothetical protein SFU53_15775 [Terrimicrobiaceae bacterium]|nr:hypothetical protein [Terrimicrobiaceae bacterium]